MEYWKNGLSFYSYFNAAGLASPGIRASSLGEVDGDGRADLLLADAHPDRLVLRIHRGQSNGLASTESVAATFWINLPQPSSTWRAAFADYNGDQLTDVALVRVRTSFTVQDDGQGRVFLFLSNGQGGYSTQEAGRFAFPAQPSLTDESTGGKLHLVSLDSNGDRYSDLCVLTYLSNPTKLQAACQTGRSDVGLGALTLVTDTQIGAGTIPLVPPTIGDINGDGMSEILVLTADGTNSRLLRGGTSGSVLVSGYVVPAPPSGTNATALAAIADVDNDGTGDLIRAGATPNSMWIAQYPADRTGALGAPQKIESPNLTLTGQHVPQLLTADVANAGAPIAMLALHALNGGTRFLCSSSCGFRHLAAPPAWGPDASTKPRAMTLNRTGEGRPDLILMNEGVGGSQPRRVDRLTQTGAFVNRISRRVGTMGDLLDISYRAARLFADAISRTSATCIPSCGGIATDTRPLVSQIVRSNGRGFEISHTLDYVNGRRRLGDHSQRAALGFQQIKLSQTETARTLTTDYYQVHPYDRLVEQRILTTGGLISTEEYFLYDYVSGDWNTIPRVLLTEVNRVIREGGQLERAEVTRYEYDSYLNRTSVETCSNGTNCRKRQTKFSLSPGLTSQWLISRPEFEWVVSSGTGLHSMERYTFGTTSQLSMTMAKVERLLFADLESAWCAHLPGNPEGQVPCGEEVSAGAARWVETLSVIDWTPGGLPQNLRQMGGETATLQYGNAQQSLPTQVFQPSLGTVTIERDLFGREIAWVDGAGVRHERPVNALGRPTSLRAPGLPQTTIETYWYNSMGQSNQHVLIESIRGSGQTTSRRVQYFDGFGSVYRTAIPTDAGPELREDQTFAWNGGFLTRTTTYPYFSNAGPDGRAIQVKYDSNGRPLVMNDTGIPGIGNNGIRKRKEWIYSANQAIEKDALGELRTFQYNQAGQLWRVTDSGLTNPTVYTYDRFNNISSILLPNGDREEFSYDGWHRVRRHRVISATRPVASDLEYEYYDSGELKSRTNAASQQVTYSYDNAGRITLLAMGSDSVQFNYSGTGCLPGRLCSVTAPRWSSSYDYDGAGRIFRIRESVDGEAPRVSIRSMEPNGTLTGESTPQGSIQYIRTREGRLKFLNWNGINIATADNYLASGLPQTVATGDGVIQTTLPDQFDRPEFLTSQGSGGLLLEHVRYTYDGADRLEAVADNRDPLTMERYAVDTSQTASFVYDERNRLASASQAGRVEAFSYDDLGYPTYFEDLVVTYSVCGARKCVVGTTLTGVTAWIAEYDTAGRQTKFSVDRDRNGTFDDVLGFDFDALDRLVAVRNGAGGLIARYTYTPDGRRFLVEAWHGSEFRTTKTYFGGLYTVRSSALAPFTSESTNIGGRVTPSAVATTTRLHWAPTQAALTASAYQSQQGIASSDHADGLFYAHRGYAAQLEFVVRGTDGQEVARYSHSAFGQRIADRSTGRHIVPERFGGGADDSYSPLVYNRSRFYNPYTGLFASADDRVVGGGLDAQGFNRHSFVLNGPSMYFDPSGHQAAGGASTTVSSDQGCSDIVCGLIAVAVAVVGAAGDKGEELGRRHGRSAGEMGDNAAANARGGWMRSQSDVGLQLLEMEKEFLADNTHFADRGEVAGGVAGRFAGEESVVQAASIGTGWLLGRILSAAGRGLATFGARLTAGGWGFAAEGVAPQLGSKLEYFLGRATGNAHNIERSTQMLRQLEHVGLPDTPATRQYLTEHLTGVLRDPSNIVRVQENGRILRESLLMGPRGGLKFETVWDGDRLITGNLFGGP